MRAQREAAARATYVPTLAEFWPVFVEFIHAERRKPNTIESYTSAGRRKLLPIFGTMRLDRVTEIDVQRLKVSMQSAAPAHVNLALGVLSQVLKLARTHYPAVVVPTIKRVRNLVSEHLRVYDQTQAAALVRVLLGRPERLTTLLLALDAGLRAQEVHALRWSDVDLVRGELLVKHSLFRGELTTPKSGRPRRVPLTTRLAGLLAELGRGSEWVLPRSTLTKAGSRLANAPLALDHILASAARTAGVPNLRPHALRHTFATLLLAARLPAVLAHNCADPSNALPYLLLPWLRPTDCHAVGTARDHQPCAPSPPFSSSPPTAAPSLPPTLSPPHHRVATPRPARRAATRWVSAARSAPCLPRPTTLQARGPPAAAPRQIQHRHRRRRAQRPPPQPPALGRVAAARRASGRAVLRPAAPLGSSALSILTRRSRCV